MPSIADVGQMSQLARALKLYRAYLWGIASIMFITVCIGIGLTRAIPYVHTDHTNNAISPSITRPIDVYMHSSDGGAGTLPATLGCATD